MALILLDFPNRCIARRSGRKLDDVVEAGGQSGWIDIKGKAKEMQVGRKEGNWWSVDQSAAD